MSEGFGQQVIIDNRGGAGGTVGAEIAARAAPDGYTLFACNIASLAVSPALYRTRYDPVPVLRRRDSRQHAHAWSSISRSPATIPEFLALAKSSPAAHSHLPGIVTSAQLRWTFQMTAASPRSHRVKGPGRRWWPLLARRDVHRWVPPAVVHPAVRSGRYHSPASRRAPAPPDCPTADHGRVRMPARVYSWRLCTPACLPKARRAYPSRLRRSARPAGHSTFSRNRAPTQPDYLPTFCGVYRSERARMPGGETSAFHPHELNFRHLPLADVVSRPVLTGVSPSSPSSSSLIPRFSLRSITCRHSALHVSKCNNR